MDSAQHSASSGVPNEPGLNTMGRESSEPSLSTTDFLTTRSSAPSTRQPREAVPLWLMRVWVIIRVAFFIELGMVLVVLPWTRGWTENSLLVPYPNVRLFLQVNFLRGVISGLGFLDIGFGIWEAIRYASAKPAAKHTSDKPNSS